MATVTTIYGDMDDAQLRRVETSGEDESAFYSAVEYYLGDELVHRSARVDLKLGLTPEILTEAFG